MTDVPGIIFGRGHIAIPKAEMLARVGAIVERLRLASAYCGKELDADVRHLEAALTAIEDAHAAVVDTFQAGEYRKHNVPAPDRDQHGVSLRHYTKRKDERDA